jgi:YetA-like protein
MNTDKKLVWLSLVLCGGLWAQAPKGVPVQVAETAGIRRTAFPVSASVHFERGMLGSAGAARLMLAGKEVPAQYRAEASWPDRSVEWLEVDFNASLGPLEKAEYRLEYGEGVVQGEAPKGLAVEGGAETIAAGALQFNRSAAPLIASVKYRGEDIGKGANGLFLLDDQGNRLDVTNAEAVESTVTKPGPLMGTIEYSGYIVMGDGYRVPFAIRVEMPNSKTLVKLTAVVVDPAKRVRTVGFETPLAFAGKPLEWDFGTNRWTYGVLRAAGDSVTLTEDAKGWKVTTASGGKEQVYEEAAGAGPVRWGHVQDGKEVVALAFDGPADAAWKVKVAGDGQVAVQYAEAAPAAEHRLTLIEHFVTAPVQVGAATSPAALLSPLAVTVGAAR